LGGLKQLTVKLTDQVLVERQFGHARDPDTDRCQKRHLSREQSCSQ
jgi:hypothetical protein